MNSVLLSTSYLPSVSWLAAALKYSAVEIELYETYPKQTYRNRSTIAVSSGTLNLTVPVNRVNGNHTLTGDITIDHSKNWQQLHWRSIVTAYNKSPYFLYYRDLFEPVYHKKHTLLFHLNLEILNAILKALNISNLNITFTNIYTFTPECPDLRNHFYPKIRPRQQEEPYMERYIQVFEEINGFIPDLSCIDLLFNLGPEALPYLQRINP